jgi:hypothetical protein
VSDRADFMLIEATSRLSVEAPRENDRRGGGRSHVRTSDYLLA